MRSIRIEVLEGTGGAENRLRLFDENEQLVGNRTVPDQALKGILQRVEDDYRQPFPDNLPALGQALYDFLDGPERWLARAREASRKALQVRIDVRGRLAHLPWELLSEKGVFLCPLAHGGLLPVRQVGREAQPRDVQNRPLRLLFMACDPIDGGPSLDYEKEETLILEATRKAQLELEVEESGSLRGLEERLADFGEGYFDVFHLTGHAQLTQAGPIFVMETEEGYRHLVSPEAMQEVFGEVWPRLIFLSGCETGKAQDAGALPSFCEALVRVGAPAVLGWALPVFDDIAAVAAQEIYEELAAGKAIDLALLKTRASLHQLEQEKNRLGRLANWHLLRLYADGTSLEPLVTPLRNPGREKLPPRPPATQVFLDAQAKSEVCPRERFVGRRRPLQKGLRTLRAQAGDEEYAEGLLIYGMGGLGKSSLAARLCDRLHRRRIVLVGWFDEPELLRSLANHLKEPEWIEIAQDPRRPLQTRLQMLLEGPLHQNPVLFVLDDFEQNLEREGEGLRLDSEGLPRLRPGPLTVLTALLRGIRHTGSDSRVLITCRYRFRLPEQTSVELLALHHFQGPDLEKKLGQLDNLRQQMGHSQTFERRIRDLAGGNPRLLERLDQVVADKEIDTSAVLAAMQEVAENFREEVLLRVILDQQSAACRGLLARLSLLHLPVAWSSVEVLGELPDFDHHLTRAAALGLVEIARAVKASGSTVFISPLVAPLVGKDLPAEAVQELQARAGRHLYQAWWQEPSERSEVRALEILRLALAGREREVAARTCAHLAHGWYGQSRFREAEALCQQVSAEFEDYRILMAWARSEAILGRTAEALGHYEAALSLAPPEETRDEAAKGIFAATLHNMADIVALQGDIPRAMKLWQQSLDILEAIGDANGKAATLHNMARIVAQQGDIPRAMKLWQQSLDIKEAIGDAQGKAATLHELARIVAQQGDIPRAMNLWQQSLDIYDAIGDAKGKAATLHNMAGIVAQQGDIPRAMNLWQQSLDILEAIGDAQGKAATLHEMAGIVAQQGDIPRAMDLWQQSLDIDEAIGDAQGKAATLHEMAGIVAQQGDIPRAMNLWQQSLDICEVIGDTQGKAATLANMAWAAGQTGEPERANELYLQAARLLGQARAFQDLIKVANNLGRSEEPGAERYLAQAFWLCLGVHAPLQDTLNLAAALIQRLGVADELSPRMAAATVFLVGSRGQEHPELEQLQQTAFSLIGYCAEERGIEPDDLHGWLEKEGLLNPGELLPKLQEKLEALVGDDWIFDRSTLSD